MAAGNEVTVVGNITSDIELKVTPSGATVARFGLAWNRRFQKDGEWQEEPHFFDVTVWRELAENLADSLTKGNRVIVIGRLEQQRWEDRETGAARSKVVLLADEIGPSLRWSRAEVSKAPRDDARRSRGDGQDGDRRPAARRAAVRPEPALDDDEPFF